MYAIDWNVLLEESFKKLKKLIVDVSTLVIPNLSQPFQVKTDASDFVVGAALF
jgi:hypothetical protein